MPFVSNHGAKRKGAILSAVLCEALRSPERDHERECAQMDAPLVSPALSMKFLRFHTSQTMRWTQSSNADNGFLPVARTHLLHHILTLSSSHISSIQLSKTMSLTLDGVRTTGSDVRTQNSNLIVFLFMYSYSLYGCCKYC